MIASIGAAWTLTQRRRPFTEAETVRECMLAIFDEVGDEMLRRASFHPSTKYRYQTRQPCNVELLANNVSKRQFEELRKADVMSFLVDESTDYTDTATLCIS
ncbi:hypothetical protein ILYODFUR_017993 [Ilyodon furcidens]|uniref:DUF4371 domain-containing protein n=1 Tax=Ilyodon furcidens TaxID=33524 RepID=A0ABV0UT99_9TELE